MQTQGYGDKILSASSLLSRNSFSTFVEDNFFVGLSSKHKLVRGSALDSGQLRHSVFFAF